MAVSHILDYFIFIVLRISVSCLQGLNRFITLAIELSFYRMQLNCTMDAASTHGFIAVFVSRWLNGIFP